MTPSSVLLVDHDRDGRQLLATALLDAGFQVAEAHNGLQALQKATEDPSDVVVTDIAIPGIDGLDLCRRLRQEPATSGIALITLISGSSFLEDCERAELAGSDVVLVRPFHPAELIAEIQRLVFRSHQLSVRAKAAVEQAQALTREADAIRADSRGVREHQRHLRERTSLLRRLRTDFLELPGLRITPQEGARLWNLDVEKCTRLLDALVDEKLLVRTRDGRYKRA
jgi:CheY-like chemotaxis protein